MKKLRLILILLLICGVSCKRDASSDKHEKQKDWRISKVFFNILPSFHDDSQIMLDMEQKEVIFQRLSTSVYFIAPTKLDPNPKQFVPPKSIRYDLSYDQYFFLKDSIFSKFIVDDFVDRIPVEYDGPVSNDDFVGFSILYTFRSADLVKVERPSYSTNQNRLLNYLIISTIKAHNDSASISYLQRLSNCLD